MFNKLKKKPSVSLDVLPACNFYAPHACLCLLRPEEDKKKKNSKQKKSSRHLVIRYLCSHSQKFHKNTASENIIYKQGDCQVKKIPTKKHYETKFFEK